MAASGAKVLMLRSVELARSHGVRIHARSTFSDEEGTWVLEAEGMEQPIVSAVTHSETDVVFTLTGIPDRPGVAAMIFDAVASAQVNVDSEIAKVSLIGAGMRSHPGVAADMFEALAEAGINIEIISTSSIRISCVVRGDEVERAGEAVHDRLQLLAEERANA
jgi:aspartate kinase